MNQLSILGRWLETTKHSQKTGFLGVPGTGKRRIFTTPVFLSLLFSRSTDAFQKARLSFHGTLGGVFQFYRCLPMCFTFHSNFTPITAWVYSTRHFADAYKCAIVSRVPEMRLFLSHWVRMNRRNKLALAVVDLLRYYMHKKASSVIGFILKILQISIVRFQYNYRLYVYMLLHMCIYIYISVYIIPFELLTENRLTKTRQIQSVLRQILWCLFQGSSQDPFNTKHHQPKT